MYKPTVEGHWVCYSLTHSAVVYYCDHLSVSQSHHLMVVSLAIHIPSNFCCPFNTSFCSSQNNCMEWVVTILHVGGNVGLRDRKQFRASVVEEI